MRRISRMILVTAGYNFRMWKKNMRVIAAFLLAFILCFMLAVKWNLKFCIIVFDGLV